MKFEYNREEKAIPIPITTIGMRLPLDRTVENGWQPQSRRLWGWSGRTDSAKQNLNELRG